MVQPLHPGQSPHAASQPGLPLDDQSGERQYVALCESATAHLAAGRHTEAREAARLALTLLPRGLDAQRLLGLALLESGEARLALVALQSALRIHPCDLTSQVGVAEARELASGPTEAETEWLRAHEIAPGNLAIRRRLTAARRAIGLLDAPDGFALTRVALARIHLRSGLFEHAASEARTALVRDPERADVQVLLAEAFWRAGDEEAAAAVAAAVLSRLPDCVMANVIQAVFWHAIGKDTSALLAHVRGADPAGAVVAPLFGDRPVPPPFEEMALTSGWSRWPPVASVPRRAIIAAQVDAEADASDGTSSDDAESTAGTDRPDQDRDNATLSPIDQAALVAVTPMEGVPAGAQASGSAWVDLNTSHAVRAEQFEGGAPEANVPVAAGTSVQAGDLPEDSGLPHLLEHGEAPSTVDVPPKVPAPPRAMWAGMAPAAAQPELAPLEPEATGYGQTVPSPTQAPLRALVGMTAAPAPAIDVAPTDLTVVPLSATEPSELATHEPVIEVARDGPAVELAPRALARAPAHAGTTPDGGASDDDVARLLAEGNAAMSDRIYLVAIKRYGSALQAMRRATASDQD